MHPILEKLNAYLASASEEQLAADWELLKQYNTSGPDISDIVKGRANGSPFSQISYSFTNGISLTLCANTSFDTTVHFNLAS